MNSNTPSLTRLTWPHEIKNGASYLVKFYPTAASVAAELPEWLVCKGTGNFKLEYAGLMELEFTRCLEVHALPRI